MRSSARNGCLSSPRPIPTHVSLVTVVWSGAVGVVDDASGAISVVTSPKRGSQMTVEQLEELFYFAAAQCFGSVVTSPDNAERFSMVSTAMCP